MEILLIFGVAVFFILSTVAKQNKKKAEQQAAEARRAQQAAQASQPQAPTQKYPPVQTPAAAPVQQYPPMQAPAAASVQKYPPVQAAKAAPASPMSQVRPTAPAGTRVAGTGMREAPKASHTEIQATGFAESRGRAHVLEASSAGKHPLESSNYTGHAHQETSLTGDISCPPVPSHERTAQTEQAPVASAFRFDLSRAQQAVIYAEILGKPKALSGR